MLYRLEGIVIRAMDYGETNKIITLCTQTHGKIGVMVRGAKKVKSRYASLTQPFTYGVFNFFRGGSGLGTLNDAEIYESNHKLREDLVLAAHGSYACELIDRALQDEDTGSFWFEQLLAFLSGMREGKDPEVMIRLFEMKILQAAGYGPELEICAASRNPVEGDALISPRLGGVLSVPFRAADPYAVHVTARALSLLRVFARLDLRRLGNVDVKPETKAELKKAMAALMQEHMGMNLKSKRFLDQLDQYGFDK
ncbi:DNA repair protein RecO [Saccharibacillus sp. CPCC 101409]|uniref:DNA repair protein RecO n=1 Tax=Saccharibacillus sp. CPCC 101409 TaxID=3058041 RepID=UPI002671F37D|nr:DNA repair protein RecO [Saccharibacillus sp. CPCC 101409]MDO3409176.1 DNA repair protein RecO [Saccharibacillus sp. CPCC 101409]